MDKNQLSVNIAQVYKSLTPTKVSVFINNEDIVNIRVVSDVFSAMTFSERFKLLNQKLKDERPDIFNIYVYVFEAFTVAEASQIPKGGGSENDDLSEGVKRSAQPRL